MIRSYFYGVFTQTVGAGVCLVCSGSGVIRSVKNKLNDVTGNRGRQTVVAADGIIHPYIMLCTIYARHISSTLCVRAPTCVYVDRRLIL